ncbi:MAG TPA: peptidylprolyl isomerase [Candidatus Saccharimonadales bacterium]|nr:peptidylprolyl isomerase [Candidatus Saccharimonadales bacterium]
MRSAAALPLLLAGLFTAAAATETVPPAPALPTIDGQKAVASVNGEPVSLTDFLDQIIELHQGMSEPQGKVHRPEPSAILDRLINVRLIIQEARNIGLDKLPEVTGQMDPLRMSAIKGALVRRAVQDVKQPDPASVENVYKRLVHEWKVSPVLFSKEEDARAFVDAVGKGGDFDALAKQALASGKAKLVEEGRYEKVSDFRPEALKVLSALEIGQAGGPVRLENGFVVLRLLDERYPDDAAAHQKASDLVLQADRQTRLREYMDELRARYTHVDKDLLGKLDYDAGDETLEKLRKDTRVVAEVKGSDSITVADLTAAVEKRFYHGVESAMKRHRVDEEVPGILDRMLLERATNLEAKRLDIENSADFKKQMRDQVDNLLFAVFMKKVVSPDVKLEEPELKKYFEDHREEFTTPAMMRLTSIAFARREDAESALGKLRGGTDLQWIRENAEGQATADRFPDMLTFGDAPVAVATMPDGVQKALAGAAAGDYRFYGAENGPYYVLFVRDSIASRERPYESARKEIAEQVVKQKQEAAIEEWFRKLRAASDIEVYAKGAQLEEILGLEMAGKGSGGADVSRP